MKILSKKSLIDSKLAKIDSIEVFSPEIASKVMPGQKKQKKGQSDYFYLTKLFGDIYK